MESWSPCARTVPDLGEQKERQKQRRRFSKKKKKTKKAKELNPKAGSQLSSNKEHYYDYSSLANSYLEKSERDLVTGNVNPCKIADCWRYDSGHAQCQLI